MSFESAVSTQLSRCLFCSLSCRAGLRLAGPDAYMPDYPEGPGNDFAGLCARGSMFAELTNHRDRLLWPLVREPSGYEESELGRAVARAGQMLRSGRPLAVVDGNFDLASLANHYNVAGPQDWTTADYDLNGTIDVFDLAILANNYGWTVGGAPVPEPATLGLIVLGALAVIRRRRR